MKVWQGTWDIDGQFLLWADQAPDASVRETVSNEAIIPQSQEIQSNSLAYPTETLAEDLSLLELEADSHMVVQLLLPSDECGLLPSPELPSGRDLERKGSIHLRRWNTQVLTFKPTSAIRFLTSLIRNPDPSVRIAESLEYWLEVTKFLLDLLTRGRYLPGLIADNGSFRAYWHLVTSDKIDRKRMSVLAESMPPICRARVQLHSQSHPEASVILNSFLTSLTDNLIRSFIGNTGISLTIDSAMDSVRHELALRWLSGLSSENGVIDAPNYELAQLEARLDRWSKAVSPATPVTIVTCFTLFPPEIENNNSATETSRNSWHLEISLESRMDDSQRLFARELWRGELGFLRFSNYSHYQLEEKLLKDLALASNFFPPLGDALGDPYPESVELSTEQAYGFLKQVSPVLENAGFHIKIPKWWTESASKLGLHLKINSDETPEEALASSVPGVMHETTRTEANSFLGMDKLLGFSWQLSLGEEKLSLKEFNNLVSLKTPLVQVQGQWVELNPNEVQNALGFLESQQTRKQMPLREALQLGFGLKSNILGLPVTGFEATGWVEKLIAAGSSLQRLEQPSGFCGTLRPYQLDGLSWLFFLSNIGCGCCLADDMGLGKTIQLLALLLHERNIHEHQNKASPKLRLRPTLLIVPMSILDNWQREIKRFTPKLTVYLHHGSNRLSLHDFIGKAGEVDIVITTYSLAHRDETCFTSVQWKRIALDEAQSIKNSNTKQTKAIRRISSSQQINASPDRDYHRVVLTGTPIENRLDELWSIFDFLNSGYLGTLPEFRSSFTLPVERYRDKEASTHLTKLIRPFILRRLKTDKTIIDDLPEKIEIEEVITMTAEQAALYQGILEQMLPQVDRANGIKRKGLVLAAITKLKQICNHPALFLKDGSSLAHRSGKLIRLEQFLEVVIAEGDKTLIFTQFAQMGHLLKKHLQEYFGTEVIFLYGGVPQKARQKIVDYFQSSNGPSIFVLSLKVGGFGLNLTAANQIVHYDQWWNPAVEEQASDRAYRIGQKRNVQVRKFLCKGTLEERIAKMLHEKRQLADRIVGSAKSVVTNLTTEELRDLLKLTAEPLTPAE